MVWVIGLTGGIGSGKSVVSQAFTQLGIPVIDADIIARDLVKPSSPHYRAILDHFGQSILSQDGLLNRRKLRNIIFENAQERIWLESLLHPEIEKQLKESIQTIKAPYCILVIPLLTEQFDIYRTLLSHVIVVETTKERQFAFSKQRDLATQEDIEKILAIQATPEQRRLIADTILINDGTVEDLKKKVTELHRQFLSQKSNP